MHQQRENLGVRDSTVPDISINYLMTTRTYGVIDGFFSSWFHYANTIAMPLSVCVLHVQPHSRR